MNRRRRNVLALGLVIGVVVLHLVFFRWGEGLEKPWISTREAEMRMLPREPEERLGPLLKHYERLSGVTIRQTLKHVWHGMYPRTERSTAIFGGILGPLALLTAAGVILSGGRQPNPPSR